MTVVLIDLVFVIATSELLDQKEKTMYSAEVSPNELLTKKLRGK